jgi:hypothetical protein
MSREIHSGTEYHRWMWISADNRDGAKEEYGAVILASKIGVGEVPEATNESCEDIMSPLEK